MLKFEKWEVVMKETEITVEVFDEFEDLKQKLVDLGFEMIEEVDMQDFYVSGKTMIELQKCNYQELINNSFLLRNIRDNTEIIFKKKELDKNGDVIAEEKYHCGVDNLEDALKVFKMSNLNVWCELKQHMSVFKREDMTFLVQQVEGLGTFIEYEEDENMRGLTAEEKIKAMLENLNKLGLNIGKDFNCKKVWLKFKKID